MNTLDSNAYSNNLVLNSATFKFDARLATGLTDAALLLDDERDEIDSSLLDEFDICGPNTTIFNDDDVPDYKRPKLDDAQETGGPSA